MTSVEAFSLYTSNKAVKMATSRLAVALALLGGVSAMQLPLVQTSEPQIPVAVGEKELVSSSSLQGRIDAENLLKRAKTLYSIAELGIDEYNHPTRVIGSKGTAINIRCLR